MSQDKSTKSLALNCPVMEDILTQWRRERPDIDPTPMAAIGEILRTAERVRQTIQANWATQGLDFPGMDVMLTLRRQGRGKALSPTALSKEMMLSTSAMTNRLDRLEKRNLIERTRDPKDRRGIKIVMTEEGFDLVDQMLASHVGSLEHMLSALSAEQRDQLRVLLSNVDVE
ncbi:MarR family winged helix-turn-helix transcriptional regulator [Pseudomonadota bacterium]